VYVRSIQVAAVERALGREYPITWAIWHGFHVLRPDCMLIAGWSAYPAQAAIAWCVALRMPFVLLIGRAPDLPGGRLRRLLTDFVVQKSAAVVYSDASDAPTHLVNVTRRIRQSIQRHARRRRSRSASSDRRG
jgi:hypothetical protein